MTADDRKAFGDSLDRLLNDILPFSRRQAAVGGARGLR